jgi:hypothetical protein
MLDAGVGVQGWAEATARVRALARPWLCQCVLWHGTGRPGRGLGASGLANAACASSQQRYWRAQGGVGDSFDMVRGGGEGQRGME